MKSIVALLLFSAAAFAQAPPVLTENFESGKLDPAVWEQRVTGNAALTVEPVAGAHGGYALHARYNDTATGSYAFLVATKLPDSVRTHFFGRAWMKVTPAFGAMHYPLIFAGEPGWQMSKFNEIGVWQGHWMPSFQENKSPRGQGRGEVTYPSDTLVPLDKWFLLEWEFNDDPSSVTLWIDGQKLIDTVAGEKVDVVKFAWPKNSTTVSHLVGGYQEFGFGIRAWGPSPQPFDVYYDDIAIGTARLGAAK